MIEKPGGPITGERAAQIYRLARMRGMTETEAAGLTAFRLGLTCIGLRQPWDLRQITHLLDLRWQIETGRRTDS